MARNNKILDNLLGEEEPTSEQINNAVDIEILEADISEQKKEFKALEVEFNADIDHVDLRMAQIQGYITTLDSHVAKAKQALVNESDPNKRSKYYGIMNTALSMIAEYESLYLKAMEIKHRYRKDKSEFVLKRVKLSDIDLRKMESDDASGLNTPKLVEMINKLETMLNSGGKPSAETAEKVSNTIGNIMNIEDDPKYRL